jgi:hypothetical protein
MSIDGQQMVSDKYKLTARRKSLFFGCVIGLAISRETREAPDPHPEIKQANIKNILKFLHTE